MVVVVAINNNWFDQLLLDSLRRKATAEEFLIALNEHVGEKKQNLAEECKHMVQYGSSLLCESSEMVLDYLDALFSTESSGVTRILQNIDSSGYVACLTNFDRFERVLDVQLIVNRLCQFVESVICTYTAEDECILLCQSVFWALKWMVNGITKSLRCEPTLLQSSISAIKSLLQGISFLKENPFSALLISLYFALISGNLVPDEMPGLVDVAEQCAIEFQQRAKDSFDQELADSALECSSDLKKLCESVPKFSISPSLPWQPFREDFIYKEFRPAILTLGSIFATFRVLKTNEEIANSFLTVGEILGMSRAQIIFDILRSGFLIQLETAAGQPEQRDREALADMFVYLKVPQILSKLIDQGVSREDIYCALERISQCPTLLNELDSKKYDNTFHYIVSELKLLGVLEEDNLAKLVANRKLGLEQKPALLELLNGGEGARAGVQQQSRLQLIRLAQKAKKTFEKGINQENKKWVLMIARLMQSGEINVDAVCSVFCADGDLSGFSSKLASINSQTERATSSEPEEAKNRILMFDSTFLLLSRIQYVYMDMRLEELVGEHTAAAFYRWTKNYFHQLDSGKPMPVDALLKQNFLSQMTLLKNCQPFWNDSWDFATLVEHVPLIGDIILDEYKKDENILSTFHQMTCLMMCLVQWLETQPQSSARQSFAKALRNFGNTRAQECNERLHKSKKEAQEGIRKESSMIQQDSDDHRWLYTMLVAKKSLKQMAEGRRQKEQPYTWVINFAQRQLPTSSLFLVPDLQMLKEAFLYSNQQSWASPDVIAHINRCNKCWMMQMLKSWTSDEMEVASELCLSAALTNDVPCLLEITRQLVEYVLYDFNTTSRDNSFSSVSSSSSSTATAQHHYQPSYVNISINKTSATVLAKMLVRVLTLLLWAEDRRKLREKAKLQRNLTSRKRKHAEGANSAQKEDLPADTKTSDQLDVENQQIPMETSATAVEPLPETSTEELSMSKAAENKTTSPDEAPTTSSSAQAQPTPTSEQQRSSNQQKDPVIATIVHAFERFDKMIKGSCLRPPVTFIIFFMHEMAKAPRTTYWKRLLEIIPINLIFALARLDAAAVPLPMFLSLYDINEEKYRLHCLKYACMMRKFRLI